MFKPINLGILGLGRMSMDLDQRHLKGKEEMFRIAAVCDIMKDRCERMSERCGCASYDDIDKLVSDPNVELVYIATRSIDHFAHAKAALEAGKYVLLEKPMTTDYQSAKALADIAKATGGKLFIHHNRRFEPGFQHIREIIASGILGDVFEIKLRRLSFNRRDDWQTLLSCGGGQLLNWGAHIIDHSLLFLESPVKSMWSDLKNVVSGGDAEDHIKIVFTGENGRVVDMEISTGAAIGEQVYLVWGTRGALSCDDKNITLRYIDPAQELTRRVSSSGTPDIGVYGTPDDLNWIEETIPIAPKLNVGMTSAWDYLYRAVREGGEYPITLEQALGVMKVISAARAGTQFE